uniref:Protein amnionless n=2 Tax=Anser brachyrhynchus TaxID=132585 RepID=A0A8B9C3C5_9AVES
MQAPEACSDMDGLIFLLSVLQLLAAAMAAYKQWIPNTNFETASNWDKERVPCASDVIRFEKNKVLSVFVRSPHAVTDMFLPLNGELLLAPGAGFAAFDGSWDAGCGSGTVLRFADAEQRSWFDPALWQDVSPAGDQEPAGHIFSVDEERVPCQYDDVIFQPETSFRVNLDSSRQAIRLRSISLMGQELSSAEAWAEYLGGPSAPRQFHGNGTLQVTGTRCPHSSGCACGNTQVSPPGEIWGSALGARGDSSPSKGAGGRGTDAALLSSRTDTASARPCSGQRGARRCPARAPCGPSATAAGSAELLSPWISHPILTCRSTRTEWCEPGSACPSTKAFRWPSPRCTELRPSWDSSRGAPRLSSKSCWSTAGLESRLAPRHSSWPQTSWAT